MKHCFTEDTNYMGVSFFIGYAKDRRFWEGNCLHRDGLGSTGNLWFPIRGMSVF